MRCARKNPCDLLRLELTLELRTRFPSVSSKVLKNEKLRPLEVLKLAICAENFLIFGQYCRD